MTLLPAVRERIDDAAARRARAPSRATIPASLTRRPQLSLGAAAAVLAATLALLAGSWTAPHPPSERAVATLTGAGGLFTPATPARLHAATDLRWDPSLSENLP